MTSYPVPLRSGGPAIDEKRVIDRDQCEMMETHSAVVSCWRPRTELKKPVNLGFVDLSTPEARAAACQREAEPNRRFAPDVYLGVMEVFDSARMTRVTMLRCTTHPSCDNGRQPELAHQATRVPSLRFPLGRGDRP